MTSFADTTDGGDYDYDGDDDEEGDVANWQYAIMVTVTQYKITHRKKT